MTISHAIDLAATAARSRPGQGPRPGRRLGLALFTGSYNLIKDGVALTLNRLVRYLEGQGVDTLVFAPDGKAAFETPGAMAPVPSMPLPLRPEYRISLGLPAAARRRLEAFEPDLIHIATPDLLGLQALEAGRRMGVPVVASYHTRYETYLRHYGLQILAGALARRIRDFYVACDEVYAPSASMAQVLAEEGARNVRLWARGVDAERFNPARRSMTWRASLGLAPDELVIAFVGRLVREKRLATFAQACRDLADRGVACRPLVVGDGPDRDALRAQLPEAVFAGFLDGDDLARAYASADVFFFPSDTETFGNVTLEAMASGLPTLCADATGSRSLVVHGETGFLAPADRPDAFRAHLEVLAADSGLRRAMGAAARRRSLGFSWDEVMAGLLDRYEALVRAA